MKNKPLQDELTTEMHAEFLDDIPLFDLKVMGVYGNINRGNSLSEALKRYELTEKEYLDNLERVLRE